jgi:hypothetical protein
LGSKILRKKAHRTARSKWILEKASARVIFHFFNKKLERGIQVEMAESKSENEIVPKPY